MVYFEPHMYDKLLSGINVCKNMSSARLGPSRVLMQSYWVAEYLRALRRRRLNDGNSGRGHVV
eukprot:592873-Amphidinium_carterae.2